MPRKLTSWVWEHCQRSEDGNEAICNLCSDVLQIRGSTSSLIKHLNNVHTLDGDTDPDVIIPRKRRNVTPHIDDNAMDMETSSDSVNFDREVAVVARNETDESNSTSTGISVWANAIQSSTESISASMPPQQQESLRPHSRSTRTMPHSRVRSVASGTRIERPRNRDRAELTTQALTKIVIVDMLPISFVDSPGFRDFMTVEEPNYQVPCAKTLKTRITLAYEKVSTKIAAVLAEVPFVACTSDCWSSRNQHSYISVMAHYLDSNWCPKRFALASEELSERHTAANLTERLTGIMERWKLTGKVTAVVTDNAASAKNAVRDLDIFFNTEVTCAAHSLQLCVTKALKNEEAAAICEKTSKVVAHFRHSNVATTALQLKQSQLGLKNLKLIQSCATRWDSTFSMIERFLLNRGAVTNVLTDRTTTKPTIAARLEVTEREWLKLEKLFKILKPLQLVTTVLCSDSVSPISIVRPIVYTLRDNHLCQSADDDVMIKEIKNTLCDELTARFDLEYDTIMGVNVRQVASFLDPRYKDLLVESTEARSDIRSFVRELFCGELMETQEVENHETSMDFLFQSAPASNSAQSQFEMYLTEPQISHNLSPFEWWSTREKRYPVLRPGN